MSGILFFATTQRSTVVDFYMDRLEFELWLEQDGCTILRHENLLLGFCDGDTADTNGIVTIVLDTEGEVEAWYSRLQDVANSEPVTNERYDIYHFFGTDPEGRTVEVQTFGHELPAEP
jgi:hypothetical protein